MDQIKKLDIGSSTRRTDMLMERIRAECSGYGPVSIDQCTGTLILVCDPEVSHVVIDRLCHEFRLDSKGVKAKQDGVHVRRSAIFEAANFLRPLRSEKGAVHCDAFNASDEDRVVVVMAIEMFGHLVQGDGVAPLQRFSFGEFATLIEEGRLDPFSSAVVETLYRVHNNNSRPAELPATQGIRSVPARVPSM